MPQMVVVQSCGGIILDWGAMQLVILGVSLLHFVA